MAHRGKKQKAQPPVPQGNHNLTVAKIQQQSFSGPLPHPRILAEYNQIVPGSAEKIISLWETQVTHRQRLESKAIISDIRQNYVGSALGFIIALAAIGAGTYLAANGRPTEGITAIVSALASLVAAFGWGSYQRRKERNSRINQ